MKNLFLITFLTLSIGALFQKPLVAQTATPKTGNLTLSRADIKFFLQSVEQDMVGDTIDSSENITLKKSLEDALKSNSMTKTINGIPARYVKKMVNQASYYIQQYEQSKREVMRINNILVEWKSTGDTALKVLDGDISPMFEKEKIKAMARKGKMTN